MPKYILDILLKMFFTRELLSELERLALQNYLNDLVATKDNQQLNYYEKVFNVFFATRSTKLEVKHI